MSSDVETLVYWIRACLIVASICTTAFPVLYAFFPWHTTILGRLLMIQAFTFALAVDVTLLFQFWTPTSIMLIFWVNAIVFTAIAASTLAMTIAMLLTNSRDYKTTLRRRSTDV